MQDDRLVTLPTRERSALAALARACALLEAGQIADAAKWAAIAAALSEAETMAKTA